MEQPKGTRLVAALEGEATGVGHGSVAELYRQLVAIVDATDGVVSL